MRPTNRVALKADKYVTINRLSDDHVEVAVVGIDDREIASSSRFLQEYVVKWMDVVNKNPSRVPVPEHDPDTQYDPRWAWVGFSMYGEWDQMKQAISTLRQISRNLGMKVYIGKKGVRGWPKPPRMASKRKATRKTTDRQLLIRLASSLPKGSEERKAILAGLKQPRGKTAKETRMGDYTVATQGQGLAVRPKGTGDMGSEDGHGFPIYIEGTTVYIWGDINKEDPTHKISFAGAKEKNRRDDK